MQKLLSNQKGLTLVEVLLGALLASMVVASAMEFYASQNNAYLAQQEVSNMQQNGRVAMDELMGKIRLAGGGLPDGITPIVGKNANPDTITLRYVARGGNIDVGDHTQKSQATPIHVARGTDLSAFSVGQVVCLWHQPAGPVEWFTITDLKDNVGAGWFEVWHGGVDFAADPLAGDKVLAMQEFRYFIDKSNALHPTLMRAAQGGAPAAFAEDIENLDFVYTLTTGATTTAPLVGDTVKVVSINLGARTQNKDVKWQNNSGFRQRAYASQVFLRNAIK
jgi:hypothetical protein